MRTVIKTLSAISTSPVLVLSNRRRRRVEGSAVGSPVADASTRPLRYPRTIRRLGGVDRPLQGAVFSGMILSALLASGRVAHAGPLSLESFFQGRLTAKGSVENYRDGTKREFTIDMRARWDGPKGTLTENVAYADGERETKVWSFDKIEPGRFVGHRADLTREAEVTEDAEGVRMAYKARIRVPAGDTFNLAFDDRLTALSPTTVSVKCDISYLFIPEAQITMTITKSDVK